jgi:hypothetical protein
MISGLFHHRNAKVNFINWKRLPIFVVNLGFIFMLFGNLFGDCYAMQEFFYVNVQFEILTI